VSNLSAIETTAIFVSINPTIEIGIVIRNNNPTILDLSFSDVINIFLKD